jgi:hypothetical protein
MRTKAFYLLLVAACIPLPRAIATTIAVPGDLGDGVIDVDGLAQNQTLTSIRVGTGGSLPVRGIDPIFLFRLPTVVGPTTIASADLHLAYLGTEGEAIGGGQDATPEFNADLFGLGVRSTATILSSDYYAGNSSGGNGTLIQSKFLVPSTLPAILHLSSSAQTTFTNYLQSLYNPNGTPSNQYLVLRLNADIPLPDFSNPIRGYAMASADNSDAGLVPVLLINTVPEPSSLALACFAAIVLLLVKETNRATSEQLAMLNQPIDSRYKLLAGTE